MIPSGNYACSICGKGFEKRTSQDRHISYCRNSKSRGRSRKKACLACTKAKTHCDAASPGCSRCVAKNVTCHYNRPRRPVSAGTAVEPSSSSDDGVSLEEIATLPFDISSEAGIELIQASQNGVGIPFTNSLEQSESISAFSDMYDMSFETSNPNQNTREPLQLSYPNPTTRSTGVLEPEIEEDIFTFSQLLPKPPRGFFPRTTRNQQFSLNRKYMITTLRSYPFAMLPGKSQKLPAFIHPQSLGRRSKNVPGGGDSPLENCLAIVQMWSVKNEANSKLIWKTVRLEQERLSSECSQYDDWTIVAGLQAITVYCLLRVAEQDDEHMNFDLPLIRTMIKLSQHTYGMSMRYSRSPDGGRPSWEAWVLVESLRRTITVLFLINILFDYSILLYPHICDGSELLRIALPCGRDLWQARSRAEWEREYALKAAGNQLTYGDLVNSRFRSTDRTLDSWLEQLDDFGTLVMAAASLGDG